MKLKSKLWLLSLGSLILVGAPGLIAASCTVKPAYQKGEYSVEFNGVNRDGVFEADSSSSYGTYNNTSAITWTGSELIRRQALTESKTQSITDKDGKTQTYLTKPTFARYKLELAEAIVLTDKNGKTYTFDSDEIPAEAEWPKSTKTVVDASGKSHNVYEKTNSFVQTKGDENTESRSVNSKFFLKKLSTASKIQFVIRKGVKWVDHEGKDTGYTVKPRDFWYSWLRTYSRNADYRHETGGTAALDEQLKNKLAEANSVVYGKNWSFLNIYTYALFGIDANKLFDENKFITKVADGKLKDREAITFSGFDGKEKDADIAGLFETQFASGTYDFMPAPSDYIDDLNKKNEQIISKSNGNELSKAETEEYRKSLNTMDKNSLQYKTGQYWYGTSYKSQLYSGYFYNAGTKNQVQRLPKNKLYWDQQWAKDDTTIQSVVFNYQSKQQDPALFNQTQFRKYQQGTISQIGYSQLTDPQKAEVSSNPEKYGLKLLERLNIKNSVYGFIRTPFVSSKLDQYKFNENFAKLVYGASLEDIKSGKADTSTSYLYGKGLSFRTLLYAAINWDAYALEASAGQASHWLAKVPDGSNLGGKDQGTSKYDTVSDFRERANSLFAIDKDGNKVDFGSELGKELSPSENQKSAETASDTLEKLRSAGFKIIQQKMKELLDEFFKEQGIADPKKQEIQFDLAFKYINAPKQYLDSWDKLQKTFKALDPRITATVKSFDNPEDPNLNLYRLGGVTGEKLLAWSNDYNGVASSYDGLSWGASLITALVKIAKEADKKDDKQAKKFAENFPEITKLAKKLLEYAKNQEHKPNLSLDFEKIDQIDNRYQGEKLPTFLANYEFKLDSATNKYVLKLETYKAKDGKEEKRSVNHNFGKDSKGNDIEGTDLYQWSSIFWARTFKELSNEEIAKIVEEFTTFVTTGYSSDIFIGRYKFSRMLINKHYIAPTLSGSQSDSYQDWRIVK